MGKASNGNGKPKLVKSKSDHAARKSTQSSGIDGRRRNKGRVENLRPFKSRAELGGALDPRINVGGRPKKLGEAHAANLERLYPQSLITPAMQVAIDETMGQPNTRVNYAEKIAIQQQLAAAGGDVSAAREIRAATEGDKVRTWEDDLADLVREGKATLEDVRAEFGAEIAKRIAVRMGVIFSSASKPDA